MKHDQSTDYCPADQTLEAAQKEKEQVPTFSYYMMEVTPMDIYPRAGDSYDQLPIESKNLIDRAISRYIEWLSKIHHGIIENPLNKTK